MKNATQKSVILRHLLIDSQKQIGIKFTSDKVIALTINSLPNIKWSDSFRMAYLLNTKENLNTIFDAFKGIAWVNGSQFFDSDAKLNPTGHLNLDIYRKRFVKKGYEFPESFLRKLETKQYAPNTAKVYIAMFEQFINYHPNQKLIEINEQMISDYLHLLVKDGRSNSFMNQMINSIKFYYEIVLRMPNRFYSIDRPIKEKKLPKILSKEEIKEMISLAGNSKHRCIISLLYSAGLRKSELLNLKIEDVDSKRMVINILSSKGNKDRISLLSDSTLKDLRIYYQEWEPQEYLFEGIRGGKYSAGSVLAVVKKSAIKAGIIRKVTPHMLRHSFATHLLEDDVDIRYIQVLLGHSSTKTTEIYTRVAINKMKSIKSPLD